MRTSPNRELLVAKRAVLRHTIHMRWIAATLLVVLTICGAAFAQQQIPAASLEKLQNVLGDVRDHLWDRDDYYWHHGEFNRCIATMRLITSMDPHDTEAYEDGSWLMSSDLREQDAEAYLIEGLHNNPDVYDIYYELGNFYYFRMRFSEAIPLYAVCMSFEDTPLFVRHQLAHAYEQDGRIGEALDTWIEAEAAEPNGPIPPMHIDRIMHGGAPSEVPQSTVRGIQHRLEERAKEQAH